ncbi:folylpolyglutamate synthase, mitochondrial [Drosophila subobscura]|uniref:folylpolyglutamate synthase, mitochondrial n=1 Tax=Drosophila subobscura TaxID=7241 RepID=UPI00155B0346|nr:folylpolyglutamate synthase, mitochondrial [Drosophila subobscura]
MATRRLIHSVRGYSKTACRAIKLTEMAQPATSTGPMYNTQRGGPRHNKSTSKSNTEMPIKCLSTAAVNQRQDRTLEELVFDPKGELCNNNSNAARDNAEFERAINQLNSLQSNEATLLHSVNNPKKNPKLDTLKYLERSGLTMDTLQKLSFIHVSGSKGKGSTCALTESLLRHHGAHTGFYTSPHLVATNERIRVDGQPMSKAKFAKTFWKVFNRLKESQGVEQDMPAYFKFVTILAFHVFVEEQVDVALLEVGIGGEYDCTNVVPNVSTVGIVSLGLEHTDLLGKTLGEIAWQKAGIIKPGSHVFTNVDQPECLEVICQRAQEKKATLHVVPPTREYFRSEIGAKLWDTFNEIIHLNGALAIQLASDWLSRTAGPLHHDYNLDEVKLEPKMLLGLQNAHWPGRCQLVEYKGLRLHLDGAHTVESMTVCTEWFVKNIKHNSCPKILIFNRTRGTEYRPLLTLLIRCCDFDMVCFTPNVAFPETTVPSQLMVRISMQNQLLRAKDFATQWTEVCKKENKPDRGQVFDSVTEVFQAIRERYDRNSGQQLEVLVTGSIHLLGATISALSFMEESRT